MKERVLKAQVIEVIETVENRGNGVEGDPCRFVTAYWLPDGRKIGEFDPNDDEAEYIPSNSR